MQTDREPYRDLDYTIDMIRIQTVDSIPYCYENLPQFRNPRELFNWCKMNTVYHDDPKGVELIQGVDTLLSKENNYWGIYGAGDCDCFTVLTLALCVSNGWNDNYIVLVGRNKKKAVHIYSTVVFDGRSYSLDLTNTYINEERKYPYRQMMPV